MYYSASTKSFYPAELRAAYERAGTWPDDAVEVMGEEYATYGQGVPPEGMQRGSDAAGRPAWVPIPPQGLAMLADRKREAIEASRLGAEAEGVTINGIRYSGDPSNRQALREAVDVAEDAGLEIFVRWKDSDGKFHEAHPVADVWQALRAIATRRSQLIEREGELVAQIDDIEDNRDFSDDEKRKAIEAVVW